MSGDDLDLLKLGSYLEAFVPGFKGLQHAQKFPGGQSNPTYKLTAESGCYVLRRKPFGELLKSAHAIDREFRVMRALQASDAPVAIAYHYCEDDTVIGAAFYVMEHLDGAVYWDPLIPEADNALRSAIYDYMNRVLAAIHSVDLKVAGLEDFGKPGAYFERQIGRWTKQYKASETETIAEMDALIDWLEANKVPDDGRATLIHGDYRLDNLIFERDSARALAVLDWELSTIGHPFADLAYQCMQWRLPNDTLSRGLGDIDRRAHGIPTEEEYVGAYCKRMGVSRIDNWEFYLAFSFFRLAAILQGVRKRALDGNASNQRAMEVGKLTRPLARQAMELVTGEGR